MNRPPFWADRRPSHKVDGVSEEPAVDVRITRTRNAVIEAMHHIFEEEGASGLTHQRVALKAGVGRATVYRHWPTTLDLLVETLRGLDQPLLHSGEEPFEQWLRLQLRHAATEMALPTARQFIATMIAEADTHTAIAELGADLVEKAVQVIAHMIDRGVERGELKQELDPEDVLAKVFGPIIYRSAMQRRPVTPEFIDGIVDSLLVC
jgi:AcrR family transcriptional regulator